MPRLTQAQRTEATTGQLLDTAVADRGARDYLQAHPVVVVECGDIGSGVDVDVPQG